MQFSQLPSLPVLQEKLVQQVARGQVPHALMFIGKTGGGQWSTALAFSTFLLCQSAQKVEAQDSCGRCSNCRKMSLFSHPDVHFVFPVGNQGNGKNTSAAFLEDWRRLNAETPFFDLDRWLEVAGIDNKQANISVEESRQLTQKLSLSAFEGGYKVVLMWLPEYMNAAAANALLKLIEEPPAHTFFLLVSENPDAVLLTIRSRVQSVQVPPYTAESIEEWLIRTKNIPSKQANEWAVLSEGNMLALEALMQSGNEDSHLLFRDWLRHCWKADWHAIAPVVESLSNESKVTQRKVLEYGITALRECIMWQHTGGRLNKFRAAHLEFVQGLASVLSQEAIEGLLKELTQSLYYLERNVNNKLVFANLSIQLISALQKARKQATRKK
jgi:DNA polymerase-3 subunit delta'